MKRSLLLAISALALTATSQQLIAAKSETAAPQERAAPAAERQRAAPARQLQRAPVQRQGAQFFSVKQLYRFAGWRLRWWQCGRRWFRRSDFLRFVLALVSVLAARLQRIISRGPGWALLAVPNTGTCFRSGLMRLLDLPLTLLEAR